jgi:hypothetical protein
LTTLSHPELGEENITVWTPDTRNKYRLSGQSQVACRGSGDGSQTSESLGEIIVWYSSVELVVTKVDLSAYGSNPACVCVNDAASHGDAHREAELVGG